MADPPGPPIHPDDPLTRLRGVGPKTAEAFAGVGYSTVRHLLLHLPRRYEDRSGLTSLETIRSANPGVLVRGRVDKVRVRRIPRRRLTLVDGVVTDGSGSLPVVWFNQPWIAKRFDPDVEFYFYGQVRKQKGGVLQLFNPEVEEVAEEGESIVPVYPRIVRFGGRRLRRLVRDCLPAVNACVDPLPARIRERLSLPDLDSCLTGLHAPPPGSTPEETREIAARLNAGSTGRHRRLAFDELLAFACLMRQRRRRLSRGQSPCVSRATARAAVERLSLPFDLTAAQKRVADEVVDDLARPVPMARLIQGDVGSGKTAVAAVAMAAVAEAGHQVAIMAPTELLAEQHLRTLCSYFAEGGPRPALLVGSLSPADRKRTLTGLADGSINVVIGTHALFQEAVAFHDLGLVVVDEQHRFGVVQRSALAAKGEAPHLLVMTATPIPRSLALTVYGDLDLSIIDELPPGRSVVRTEQRAASARSRVFEFLRKEISEGGRVFVVFPLIDASEDIDAAALTERHKEVCRLLPGVSVGAVHGRLGVDEREAVTEGFRSGAIQVLLSTTVVEVGVDVPEATVMVVESAQRFGLSQLHQLRGRVGRGTRQAWCILMTGDDPGEDARRRLEVMCSTNDGFEIAEADLEQRGPGELVGTRQWGPAGFRFADLIRDRDLIQTTRRVAADLEKSRQLTRVLGDLSRYHPIDDATSG